MKIVFGEHLSESHYHNIDFLSDNHFSPQAVAQKSFHMTTFCGLNLSNPNMCIRDPTSLFTLAFACHVKVAALLFFLILISSEGGRATKEGDAGAKFNMA